ncbi:DUF4386 domain-containing protein [Nonomuraea sp. NEAU-A123]|uniref:DUF4386 domain-containing protein n=1 Tax=Nonomuraea sp. NEAU-A123 TaxID=2839649 RepID=UPI001BE3E227|nr:DUF4386 domain-containing protein [Nonomuraea sp. NEAU-A123]MBT2225686.1 DUF4386 family protein [Nonomuraea sp. NEAU-A123]
MRSPQRLARTAGLFYLIVAIFGGFAHLYVRAKVYVPGDATTTAHNTVANAGLVRVGFVADLVQAPFFLFVAMSLYLLLKHVNKDVARAMVTFVAIAVAITCLNMVHQLAALIVATEAPYATALSPQGSDALVLLMFDLHHYGYLIAQIFFGLWLLPLGYLAYRSRMFPRTLGVLLVAGCGGYLVDTFALFLAPDLGAALNPFVVAPAGIAEIVMLLWLLVKGVKTPRQDGPVPVAA